LIISNRSEILREGNVPGRTMVLEILEHALREVSFYKLVNNFVKVGDKLTIGAETYDLKDVGSIYVLGAGKQVSYMAAALENILGERITDGLVIEKHGWGRSTDRIRSVKGGHPLPDEHGVEGAKEIVRLAGRVKEDSLAIVCTSGGCTSLAALPPECMTLQEVRTVFQMLLNAGAPIDDQNTVRKHLSQLGEGKLSMLLKPAQTVGLIAVDEVSGLPWGPTVPDTTTFKDAINVLQKYNLWNTTPESIRRYFQEAPKAHETPKSADFVRLNLKCDNLVLANNNMLCDAAMIKAKQMNLNARILTTTLEGEAKDVGTVLGSIGLEVEKNDRPFKTPCAIIAGGETTVTLGADSGQGGRNQELALSAALKISNSKKVVIASLGTDGSDGPTEIAGAIVDGDTAAQSDACGLDLFRNLKTHDSATCCRKLGNAIYTNDTETNLMDLIIVYIA